MVYILADSGLTDLTNEVLYTASDFTVYLIGENMLFAIAEDGMIWVLEDEAAAKVEFEPIDVESQVFVFYAEDGTWLKPHFIKPNRRRLFGLLLDQGEYELVPAPEGSPEVDPFEVAIAEVQGVTPNRYFKSVEEIRNHVEAVKRRHQTNG